VKRRSFLNEFDKGRTIASSGGFEFL